MLLSHTTLAHIQASDVSIPTPRLFELPERVLQFGTGVLLRGLPDYFIDKANRRGLFNGRVVVVKSTDTGSTTEFDQQDSLYTLHIRGIQDGRQINEQVINSAISRVISAAGNWHEVLRVAVNPDLQVVISNTTEVGLQLVNENISQNPPASFPGKLLAVLHERYKAFEGSALHGLIIIPTELITDNGKKLKAIVLELAQLNGLEPAFIAWIEKHNTFCSSLVDRIVPGKPNPEMTKQLEEQFGYEDGLRIIAEPYALWAIEGNENVAGVLSFSKADAAVVITPDIELFRELKLRLLNGTHTLSCATAYLSGFRTVREAMDNPAFSAFITDLMLKEIAVAIPYPVDYQTAADFAAQVLDRFQNPFIEHQWISISLQYSTKMKMRVIPLLLNFYKKHQVVPEHIAFGFAAYLRFMKTDKTTQGKYQGHINNSDYIVNDTEAYKFNQYWQQGNTRDLVNDILKDESLWDADISRLPGFAESVNGHLNNIIAQGAFAVLSRTQGKKRTHEAKRIKSTSGR